MLKIFVAVVLLIADIYCVALREDNDRLLAVALHFRHGDRTPKGSFRSDKVFKSVKFSVGYAHLTNKGIDRQYRLGQWLRQRYDDFLPQKYEPGDILVMSTDVDRTLMSATANLAGLYPPKGEMVWNEDLLWRPIPVHTTPKHLDMFVAMKKRCAKRNKLNSQQKKSDFYQKIKKKYAKLYDYLSEHSGKHISDVSDVKKIRTTLNCYESMNSSYIPSWFRGVNKDDFDYVASLAFQRSTFTDTMKLLKTGPFFHHLITYFDNVRENVPDTPIFRMFSGHDTTVVPLLDSMGVFDFIPPNFAACIIWELKVDADDIVYVKLLYRKGDNECFILQIPGCHEKCPLDEFKSRLAHVTVSPEKWEKLCENGNSRSTASSTDDADD